eukprot:4866773-Alexandrium_andersonii.AAC.1
MSPPLEGRGVGVVTRRNCRRRLRFSWTPRPQGISTFVPGHLPRDRGGRRPRRPVGAQRKRTDA